MKYKVLGTIIGIMMIIGMIACSDGVEVIEVEVTKEVVKEVEVEVEVLREVEVTRIIEPTMTLEEAQEILSATPTPMPTKTKTPRQEAESVVWENWLIEMGLDIEEWALDGLAQCHIDTKSTDGIYINNKTKFLPREILMKDRVGYCKKKEIRDTD